MEFVEGKNCWKTQRADRLSVIIDGSAYFRALRQALLLAQRQVFLIGWDFDFELEMLPGESDADETAPDGFPNRIGAFLDAIAQRNPDLDIYILQWSGGVLIAPGQMLPSLKVKFLSPAQVHLAYDGHHPVGASHHQKIVAIDDALAFCGGIDVTEGRWDTKAHRSGDPLRRLGNGTIAQPWHDAAVVLDGPAARALSTLARQRWKRSNHQEIAALATQDFRIWPQNIRVDFTNVTVAIARTEPPERNRAITNEIETLYLDAISAAQDYIYIESQYFCSDSITTALARRLDEKDGPDVVVVNPFAAVGQVEDLAMNVPRSRMIRQLRAADRHGRFAIFYPVTTTGEPIYVHAKIFISDGTHLRVGSSNIDQRSMGFDTECDVALLGHDGPTPQKIREILCNLLAEHMGCNREDVANNLSETRSLIKSIDRLNSKSGRGLRSLEPRPYNALTDLLATSRIFDPRYRQSAKSRIGITSRHLLIGLAVVAGASLLWSRRRTNRK